MLLILDFIVVALVLTALSIYLFKFKSAIELTKNIPSPPSLPIIGHGHYFVGREPFEFFLNLVDFIIEYGDTVKLWFGPALVIFSNDVKVVEAVTSSTRFNDKAQEYKILKPWLNEGLLLSTGSKWHKRRKIITPAFHFTILEQFIEIFESKSRLLVQNLHREYQAQNDNGFSIYEWISLCTLDTICETAMGVSANTQCNSNNSEYVRAVRTISTVLGKRMFDVFYRFDFIYKLTQLAREEKKALKILHGFTEKIIKQRREELLKSQESNKNNGKHADRDIGAKRKITFLDVLLQSEIDGQPLTDLDIREEVDTFVFEGHDTTSAAITFFFYCMAMNPECQQKCFKEIISIIGDDPSKPITNRCLNNMQYVELCIKETMRFFPSVPFIAREAPHECEINGMRIPAGACIVISPFAMGRTEKLFPEAHKFKPERFDVVTNAERINPYTYIPFAAGPRNCIGQKFAMLEMKTIIANVLRHYEVEFVDDGKPKYIVLELILRTKHPLMFKIKPRCE